MIKKEFDLFLAYHGSYDAKGPKAICDRLYKFLKENKIKTFYFPESDKDVYKANIIEAIKSRVFLLVCNENLKLTENNRIDINEHYELCTEIDAFYAMTQVGADVYAQDAKVLVCGDYTVKRRKGQEAEFHELFAKRTHMFMDAEDEQKTFNEVLMWVKSRLSLRKDAGEWQRLQVTNEVKQIFVKRAAMNQQIDLSALVANSKHIYAMGISNSELTIRINPDAVRFALSHGAEVQLLFLDPECPYTKIREEEEGLRKDRIKHITEGNIDSALDFKMSLNEEQRMRYLLFKYSKLPRMNVILLDSYAILQYYANTEAGISNPCFLIERQEISPLYDFCMNNFNLLKEQAEEIQL